MGYVNDGLCVYASPLSLYAARLPHSGQSLHTTSNGGPHSVKKVQKNFKNNYASVECGAKILSANMEAKVCVCSLRGAGRRSVDCSLFMVLVPAHFVLVVAEYLRHLDGEHGFVHVKSV